VLRHGRQIRAGHPAQFRRRTNGFLLANHPANFIQSSFEQFPRIERSQPGQQFVKQHTQTIDVGSGEDILRDAAEVQIEWWGDDGALNSTRRRVQARPVRLSFRLVSSRASTPRLSRESRPRNSLGGANPLIQRLRCRRTNANNAWKTGVRRNWRPFVGTRPIPSHAFRHFDDAAYGGDLDRLAMENGGKPRLVGSARRWSGVALRSHANGPGGFAAIDVWNPEMHFNDSFPSESDQHWLGVLALHAVFKADPHEIEFVGQTTLA